MRTTSLTLVILAVSAFTLSGCGTAANFVTLKPKVYGGVEQDANFFKDHPANFNGAGLHGNPVGLLVVLGIIPAEFCCTAIADTLTLPITMALDEDWPPPKEDPVSVHTDYPVQYSAK